MFGFLRRKKSDQLADDLNAQTTACVADIRTKWLGFCQALPFREDVPLSKRIEAFASPIQTFVEQKYPALLTGPPMHFWLMIFTAILESGTHEKTAVNDAIRELEAKYAS